nr:uncharacterized protein LOC121119036 [Lepeophtheirus salmonis]
MDIGENSHSKRASKRYDLFEGQWKNKRYNQHRARVESAASVIDVKPPISSSFKHIKVKSKKLQKEEEKHTEVMTNNLILLRHLSEISVTKRIDDGEDKKIHWGDYYEDILMLRQDQIERLKAESLRKLNKHNYSLRTDGGSSKSS